MVCIDLVDFSLSRLKLGSFLFDIFLGPSYNQSPPSVKYMTVMPSAECLDAI